MLITTFKPSDWNNYARRAIESFLTRWPKQERIRIYFQGALRDDYLNLPRVEYFPLKRIPNLMAMRDALGKVPHFRGMLDTGGDTLQYSYRHDAHKWCLKAFALAHGATTIDERMAWCDADVFWHTDVPENFLLDLLPDEVHLAVLDRSDIPMYPETGFVGVNPGHPMNSAFWRMYMNVWLTGAIGLLREWHCCEVLEFVYRSTRSPIVNLAEGLDRCTHPAVNSILGEYMDHCKGPTRKKTGHSTVEDLVVDRRDHPYWGKLYRQAG